MNLIIPIKKEWFDLICSGEKKEEYREIKNYWHARLFKDGYVREFSTIEFRNGYGAAVPSAVFEFEGVDLKKPNPKWCPKEFLNKTFYAIKIGQKLR